MDSSRLEISQYVTKVIEADIDQGYLRSDIDPRIFANAIIVIMNSTHEWLHHGGLEWNNARDLYMCIAVKGILSSDHVEESGGPALAVVTEPQHRLGDAPVESEDRARLSRGERWEELARVAGEVFAERSYPGASLSEIARRFGVRKASLYHYIDNKEELFFENHWRGTIEPNGS